MGISIQPSTQHVTILKRTHPFEDGAVRSFETSVKVFIRVYGVTTRKMVFLIVNSIYHATRRPQIQRFRVTLLWSPLHLPALRMGTARPSNTTASFYRTTRRHILDKSILHSDRCEIPKS
jgi:hypothetical protein